MLCVQGQGVVKGIAIGKAVVMGAAALEVSHYTLAQADVAGECERLRNAIAQAREEMQALVSDLPDDAPRELGPLLTVHGLILDDPMLVDQVCDVIVQQRYNAEWALTVQAQVLAEQFASMSDEYLRERASDIRQVIERVLRVLSGSPALLPDIVDDPAREPLIVVARDVSPADMLRLREGRFSAFLTDLGGATSHTAIVARSMNVPAVVGLGSFRALVQDGDCLIVDGYTGAVIVNPSAAILDEYHHRQAAHEREREALDQLRTAPAVTIDGVSVDLQANIELPEEAATALRAGASGIGLFRTEFLFMGRKSLPTEQEQFNAYRHVVQEMGHRPVTIRTLDLGADKALDDDAAVASNPALGLRAVRYCLAQPELFVTQLRALLRASHYGHIRILVPMLTHEHEIDAVQRALAAARQQLAASDPAVKPDVSLGAMVETPAAAIAIEPFARALDFLSIGTNDLIQYTLAVDRADAEVADLYDPLHPAVLRLISHVITAGERLGTPVAMCGEMAGDPQLTPLLLGLGLTSFSMHSQQLPDVKSRILKAHSSALRFQLAAVLNRGERMDAALLQASYGMMQ